MSEYLNQVNETVIRLYVEAKGRLAEERGQTAAEYLGIIVVAALIMTALTGAAPGMGSTIVGFINERIQEIGGK